MEEKVKYEVATLRPRAGSDGVFRRQYDREKALQIIPTLETTLRMPALSAGVEHLASVNREYRDAEVLAPSQEGLEAIHWIDQQAQQLIQSYDVPAGVRVRRSLTQVVRYGKGGHIHSHVDDSVRPGPNWKRHFYDRILSATCYLNDQGPVEEPGNHIFTGGDFVFEHTGEVIKPRAGLTLFFPSCKTHPHHATAVTSDTPRFVIVCFYDLRDAAGNRIASDQIYVPGVS